MPNSCLNSLYVKERNSIAISNAPKTLLTRRQLHRQASPSPTPQFMTVRVKALPLRVAPGKSVSELYKFSLNTTLVFSSSISYRLQPVSQTVQSTSPLLTRIGRGCVIPHPESFSCAYGAAEWSALKETNLLVHPIVKVNLIGTINSSGGIIVITGSLTAPSPEQVMPVYSATKALVNFFSRASNRPYYGPYKVNRNGHVFSTNVPSSYNTYTYLSSSLSYERTQNLTRTGLKIAQSYSTTPHQPFLTITSPSMTSPLCGCFQYVASGTSRRVYSTRYPN
ncbi:uncharacterized protein BDR25DRAFT_349837 [Lindgomyces ingoldianus]|uniref:Uncharacterized protein n=1 Tax=Lindgomyces ingoldianus TaxID=673940 RepID=A0ACB6RC71_9PLEO|nr:uncharacterized protein BDR25DRAFT_349837 [Lindgomyces ingoldianus]KAF2476776.1 hypothetical protein BDR25DRAFT_349837 [Lindgomyces ingoldianus]